MSIQTKIMIIQYKRTLLTLIYQNRQWFCVYRQGFEYNVLDLTVLEYFMVFILRQVPQLSTHNITFVQVLELGKNL